MTKSEQARAEHECAACGGTGDRLTCEGIPKGMECGATCLGPSGPPSYGGLICGMPARYADRLVSEETLEKYLCPEHAEFGRSTPCPVCHGSGRISDRMPVADALADAETLRLAAEDFGTLRLVSGDGGWRKQRLGVTAAMLTGYRALAIDWMCGADRLAQLEARAAFRAVPGLRG